MASDFSVQQNVGGSQGIKVVPVTTAHEAIHIPEVPSQLMNIGIQPLESENINNGVTVLPVAQILLTPTKKSRGRPKKDKTAEKASPVSSTCSTPQRGRGRPRKVPVVNADNNGGAAVLTGRGADVGVKDNNNQPPWSRTPPSSSSCDGLTIEPKSIDMLAAGLMMKSGPGGPVMIPGGRGGGGGGGEDGDDPEASNPGTAMLTPAESGKRKRGRPKKTPSSAITPNSGEEGSVKRSRPKKTPSSAITPNPGEDRSIKRGRGRPRKYPVKENTGEKRPSRKRPPSDDKTPPRYSPKPKRMRERPDYDDEKGGGGGGEGEYIDLSVFLDPEGFVPSSSNILKTTESGKLQISKEMVDKIIQKSEQITLQILEQGHEPLSSSPKKRGRGRPKLNKDAITATPGTGNTPVAKKGRGRPRKNSSQGVNGGDPTVDKTPTTTTRKRGRPRKTPISTDSAPDIADVALSDVPPARATNLSSESAIIFSSPSIVSPPPPPPPPPVIAPGAKKHCSKPVQRSGDASTKVVQGSGDTSTKVVQGSGDTSTKPVQGSGDTSTKVVQGSGDTSTKPVQGSGDTSTKPVQGSGDTSTKPVQGSDDTSTKHIQGSGDTSTKPVQGSGDTSTKPVRDISTKHIQRSGDTSTKPVHGSGDTSTKHVHGSGDTSTKPVHGSGDTSTKPVQGGGDMSTKHIQGCGDISTKRGGDTHIQGGGEKPFQGTNDANESTMMGKLRVEFSDSESEGSVSQDVQRTTIEALTERVHPLAEKCPPALPPPPSPPPSPPRPGNSSSLLVDSKFEESFDEDSDN